MNARWVGVMALAALAALPAQAQRRGGGGRGGDFGRNEPNWWGSFAMGYQWSNAVSDPKTDALWNFDANWSMRASVEREVAPRTAVGLVWKYSRMPLSIRSVAPSGVCRPCDAEATIASYGVTVRSGGGRGLHLVYEGFLAPRSTTISRSTRRLPQPPIRPLPRFGTWTWLGQWRRGPAIRSRMRFSSLRCTNTATAFTRRPRSPCFSVERRSTIPRALDCGWGCRPSPASVGHLIYPAEWRDTGCAVACL